MERADISEGYSFGRYYSYQWGSVDQWPQSVMYDGTVMPIAVHLLKQRSTLGRETITLTINTNQCFFCPPDKQRLNLGGCIARYWHDGSARMITEDTLSQHQPQQQQQHPQLEDKHYRPLCLLTSLCLPLASISKLWGAWNCTRLINCSLMTTAGSSSPADYPFPQHLHQHHSLVMFCLLHFLQYFQQPQLLPICDSQ